MYRNAGFGVFGLLAAIVYLSIASSIRTSALGDPVGAAGMPRLFGWILVGASSLLIGQSLLQIALARRGKPGEGSTREDVPLFDNPGRAWLRGVGVVLIAAAYLVALPILGYIISIAVLIIGTAIYFGIGANWRVALVGLVGGLVLWVLFGVLLQVRLPLGLFSYIAG